MSYETSVEGYLTITPPLNGREIREFDDMMPTIGRWDQMALRLDIVNDEVETDEGTLTKRTAEHVYPWKEDSFRASDFAQHVRQVVDHFGVTHDFNGEFEGHGEDFDDIWRIYVWRDGGGKHRVTKIKAVITWPTREQGEELK